MENFEMFKVAFYRQVPQVAAAADNLVQLYNQVTQQNLDGELEIEAFFGKYVDGRFSNNISPAIIDVVGNLLDQCAVWRDQKDWHLIYDYYTEDGHRIRMVNPENVSVIKKVRLGHVDLSYGKPNPSWELTNHLTRVTLKLEQPVEMKHSLIPFVSAKLSMRKTYELVSGNCPGVIWRYELCKYWVAPTMQELEHQVQTEPPSLCLECEVLNSMETLSEKKKYILFAALLLKMEDFLAVPVARMVANRETQPPVALPSFLVQAQENFLSS